MKIWVLVGGDMKISVLAFGWTCWRWLAGICRRYRDRDVYRYESRRVGLCVA